MNKKIDISIIVPAYNCEKYIKHCISSLQNQTIKNIEIIVVNDGSTDDTSSIITSLAKDDKRIKLYNKKNSGVSDSRNYGILKASGKFIGFVDADDYVEPRMYEELLKLLTQNQADMLYCSYNEVYGENTEKNYFDFISGSDKTFNNYTFINEIFPKMIHRLDFKKKEIMGSVWRVLVDSKIAMSIHFLKNLKIGEDLIYDIDCSLIASRIILTNNCFYNYIRYDNSVTGKYKNDFDDINKIFHSELLKRLDSVCFFEKKSNVVRYNLNRFNMYSLINSNIIKKDCSFFEKIKNIRKNIKDVNSDNCMDYSTFQYLSPKMKVLYVLFKLRLSFLIYLIYSNKQKMRRAKR